MPRPLIQRPGRTSSPSTTLAGYIAEPYKGPIVKEDWAGMTYGDAGGQEKSQVAARTPQPRVPVRPRLRWTPREQRTTAKAAGRPAAVRATGRGSGTPDKTSS